MWSDWFLWLVQKAYIVHQCQLSGDLRHQPGECLKLPLFQERDTDMNSQCHHDDLFTHLFIYYTGFATPIPAELYCEDNFFLWKLHLCHCYVKWKILRGRGWRGWGNHATDCANSKKKKEADHESKYTFATQQTCRHTLLYLSVWCKKMLHSSAVLLLLVLVLWLSNKLFFWETFP